MAKVFGQRSVTDCLGEPAVMLVNNHKTVDSLQGNGKSSSILPWSSETGLQQIFEDVLSGFLDILQAGSNATGFVVSRHCAATRSHLIIAAIEADSSLQEEALQFACVTADFALHQEERSARPSKWSGGSKGELFNFVLPVERTSCLVITIVHDHKSRAVRLWEANVAKLMLPVLLNTCRLWQLCNVRRKLAAGLMSALNYSNIATLVLDRSANIIFSNREADDLMERRDGLKRVGDTLTAVELGDALRLQVIFHHVIGEPISPYGQEIRHGAAPVLPISRSGDHRPLIVTILPVENPTADPADPAAIVYALAPDTDIAKMLTPACRLYALTPVETKLASCLTEGLTIAETATRMHIKLQTARSYLKQIFLKTGINRQADLIRILMSSLVRIRSDISTEVLS